LEFHAALWRDLQKITKTNKFIVSRFKLEVQRPVIYYLFEKQIPLFFLFRYLAISSELSHLVTAMNLIQKKMSPPWRHHGHIYRF